MKDFLKAILKMLIVLLIIFIIPFILPIILKIFLKLNLFQGIGEFQSIVNVFNNIYTLIYIVLGIGILLWFFHKWDTIKEMIKNFNSFTLAVGDKKISAQRIVKEEMEDIDQQKEFINKMYQESNSDSGNVMSEVKERLGIIKTSKTLKCKECNKTELEEENSKLRYFATYNMINTEAKSILHTIYNEKYIDANEFKSRIIQGYKRRNRKNVKFTRKEINKIAKNKYDTILNGLKFLNIIEPSEDDKIIRLTADGKKFVEKYIEREEVV